jgi:arabinose-5-phosphate isomerase
MSTQAIIQSARQTLAIQAGAVQQLQQYVDDGFVQSVEAVLACRGRLVVSGIGKSAIIAQKIVATLNSTGTAALFMHAADAIHGDLGMIRSEDVVMLISKSGDSPEIKVLIPFLKNFGNKLIGMVGNTQSYLAQHADLVINTTVEQEACPNNLAPTSSSTAQMVMGDALAVCLMELRGFGSTDFARYHPGGALGKKLYLRVADLLQQQQPPQVSPDTPVREVILEITRNRMGAVAVINADGKVAGIVTDGDIRRMMEKFTEMGSLMARDIMGQSPKFIAADALAAEALQMMQQNNISQLLVLDTNRYAGIVHLHDLLREGII